MAPKLAESPQSEAQETFAGTPGKDRDVPLADIPPDDALFRIWGLCVFTLPTLVERAVTIARVAAGFSAESSSMFRNLHYLGVSTYERTPYLLLPKLAESWPVKGLRLLFFSSRMQRVYALSYWLKYSAQHPLDWVTPSEDAWAIDLAQLRIAFDSAERIPRGGAPATWPTWFTGGIALVPEWETVEQGKGHNRFNFVLTEWQVTKSKLPPIAGSGTTIIHGDQIHISDIQGSVGHVGSPASAPMRQIG
jgi:hypothetical protein